MDIVISSAKPDHADDLTAITIAAKRHWSYPERWIQSWIPVLTISPEYIAAHETWIAARADRIIAYYSFAEGGGALWLDNLWVLPALIGQGIGKRLFHHALRRAAERGASVLKVESDPNAQGFYEKMGARKVGDRHHGEMDGQPRILPVMEISL